MAKRSFGGRNKKQLAEEIQHLLAQVDFGEAFTSELLSDLIAEHHYYCSVQELRPTKFRKERRRGGAYGFEGYFLRRGWHLVSWRQCIYPRTNDDFVVRALRDAVQPIVEEYKVAHPICERCRQCPAEECDHVAPEFDQLAREGIELLSEADWKAIWARFDWWSEEPFRLPPDNPALEHVLEGHETAVLQAVCWGCHLRNARERASGGRA